MRYFMFDALAKTHGMAKTLGLFIALLICLFATTGYAAFEMTPGVDLSLEYDDNIFLDPDNEEDDVITTVTPNISMAWETSRLDVSLFASVSMEKYMDNTDEDRVGAGESEQASSLEALARLYRELFFLKVSDSYSRVPVDEGGRGGESNRTVNLTDSNTFRVNPYLQFELMKETQMQLGYTYTNQWYGNQSNDEDEGGDDYESHLYSASLTKELSSRTTMTLSGSHEEYRPKDADQGIAVDSGGTYEYDKESASLGLSYQATERLKLQGNYGHAWLDYEVRGKGDTDTWLASADYDITSSYTIGTKYTKSIDISVDDGVSKSDRYSAYLGYDDRFTLNFTLFGASSDYVEINRTDDSYGGQLSGELPFNNKVGVTGLLRYTNFDRTGLDAEEYDRYSTKLSLYYETRLGRISTGYIYNRNDSDLNSEDYTSNIVFMNASLRF